MFAAIHITANDSRKLRIWCSTRSGKSAPADDMVTMLIVTRTARISVSGRSNTVK